MFHCCPSYGYQGRSFFQAEGPSYGYQGRLSGELVISLLLLPSNIRLSILSDYRAAQRRPGAGITISWSPRATFPLLQKPRKSHISALCPFMEKWCLRKPVKSEGVCKNLPVHSPKGLPLKLQQENLNWNKKSQIINTNTKYRCVRFSDKKAVIIKIPPQKHPECV